MPPAKVEECNVVVAVKLGRYRAIVEDRGVAAVGKTIVDELRDVVRGVHQPMAFDDHLIGWNADGLALSPPALARRDR